MIVLADTHNEWKLETTCLFSREGAKTRREEHLSFAS